MIDFFTLSGILFSILLGSNIYYYFLGETQSKGKKTPQKNIKSSKKGSNKNLFITIILIFIILLITIFVGFFLIKSLTQNVFIFYMATITYVMLLLSFYAIQQNQNRFLYAFSFASLLLGLQIYLKIPLLGGLLPTIGYIGAVNYIMFKKIVSPKIILLFLTVYMIYDFITVFITPLQPAIANKTINDVFPSAIIYGKTILGLGDVLFTLIMTAFSRVYYGFKISVITAFLMSLPLAGLGVYSALIPHSKIAVPYLILTTPFLLIIVFILKQKGYRLK